MLFELDEYCISKSVTLPFTFQVILKLDGWLVFGACVGGLVIGFIWFAKKFTALELESLELWYETVSKK